MDNRSETMQQMWKDPSFRAKVIKGMKNHIMTPEHCQHISMAKKDVPNPKMSICMKGRKFSSKHREAMSKAQTGKVRTSAHCQNMSKARKGISQGKGVAKPARTAAHRLALSKSLKARWLRLSSQERESQLLRMSAGFHGTGCKGIFHTGDFLSVKNNKTVHYRSSYELALYKLLEAHECLVSLAQNQLKFDAADAYCAPYKAFFEIYTEARLQPYLKEVA